MILSAFPRLQLYLIIFLLVLLSPSSSFLSQLGKSPFDSVTRESAFIANLRMENGKGGVNKNENSDTKDRVDDSKMNHQRQRILFAGFDLGTSGCRMSIIEQLQSSSGGFREVYSDSVVWKDCIKNDHDSDASNGRYDDPESWWIAIELLLEGCSSASSSLLNSIASICISGTSASCLIADRSTLEVTRNPRMYDYDILMSSSNLKDDTSGMQAMELIQEHLPSKHTARSTTGSFAKLVKWILQSPLKDNEFLCHQSDYISTKLIFSTNDDKENEKVKDVRFYPQSDWQNCLKLGYDVQNLCWPVEGWMGLCLREALDRSGSGNKCNTKDDNNHSVFGFLPTKVVSPGAPLGKVDGKVAKKLGLSEGVIVVGGTTDSNAAFYAAAASVPERMDSNARSTDNKIRIPYGTAVTSLGSTTAIKFLSKTYIEDSSLGVYSHRFPAPEVFQTTNSDIIGEKGGDGFRNNDLSEEAWLVGGASNVGCAVFRALNFTDDELRRRSEDIDPTTNSEAYLRYKYYPLLPNKVGERFPIADATKKPILEPMPDVDNHNTNDVRTEYLKGLFQSISTEVERKGYEVLRDLGASPPFPTRIMTAGGGSKNAIWTSLRQRIMNDVADCDNEKVKVREAEHSEASFGAALLAAAGFRLQKLK